MQTWDWPCLHQIFNQSFGCSLLQSQFWQQLTEAFGLPSGDVQHFVDTNIPCMAGGGAKYARQIFRRKLTPMDTGSRVLYAKAKTLYNESPLQLAFTGSEAAAAARDDPYADVLKMLRGYDARRLAAIKKIQEYAGEPIAATAATPATASLRRPLRLLRWFAFGKRIRAGCCLVSCARCECCCLLLIE